MNKGGSIDVLNGWRMGVFSPGSAVVGIHGDTFSLVIWPCLIVKNQSLHFVFTSSDRFVLQAWKLLYTNTQMLCVTVVDLKENGYVASVLISIHFCPTLLHCQPMQLLMSPQITHSLENEWLLGALSHQIAVSVNAPFWMILYAFVNAVMFKFENVYLKLEQWVIHM